MNKKHRFLLFTEAAVLFFCSSCEYWEDFMDGDKPLPPGPVTSQPPTRLFYSREEAVSLVCNKLIMRFSRLPEKPAVSCLDSDVMAYRVKMHLGKANMIDSSASPQNRFRIRTVSGVPDQWHVVVTFAKSGKVLLDETIQLDCKDKK